MYFWKPGACLTFFKTVEIAMYCDHYFGITNSPWFKICSLTAQEKIASQVIWFFYFYYFSVAHYLVQLRFMKFFSNE